MKINDQIIEDDRMYDVPETLLNVKRATLAKWRCDKMNLPYTRVGARIYYAGKDLIGFIEGRRTDIAA